MKASLLPGLFGLGLGFALSRIGFASWDEVHRMFTFSDLRLFLSFCTAVTLLGLGLLALRATPLLAVYFPPRSIHRGSLLGGLLFGAGWALSGACPAIALVQLGQGQLAALYTLAGILAGNWLYGVLQARFLRWDSGSCMDD